MGACICLQAFWRTISQQGRAVSNVYIPQHQTKPLLRSTEALTVKIYNAVVKLTVALNSHDNVLWTIRVTAGHSLPCLPFRPPSYPIYSVPDKGIFSRYKLYIWSRSEEFLGSTPFYPTSPESLSLAGEYRNISKVSKVSKSIPLLWSQLYKVTQSYKKYTIALVSIRQGYTKLQKVCHCSGLREERLLPVNYDL